MFSAYKAGLGQEPLPVPIHTYIEEGVRIEGEHYTGPAIPLPEGGHIHRVSYYKMGMGEPLWWTEIKERVSQGGSAVKRGLGGAWRGFKVLLLVGALIVVAWLVVQL